MVLCLQTRGIQFIYIYIINRERESEWEREKSLKKEKRDYIRLQIIFFWWWPFLCRGDQYCKSTNIFSVSSFESKDRRSVLCSPKGQEGSRGDVSTSKIIFPGIIFLFFSKTPTASSFWHMTHRLSTNISSVPDLTDLEKFLCCHICIVWLAMNFANIFRLL